MLPLRLMVDLGRFVAILLLVGAVAGCASTGAVPRPFPAPTRAGNPPQTVPPPPVPISPPSDEPMAAPAPPSSGAVAGTLKSTVEPVVSTALTLLGAPYVNGGSTPAGFDCSGLTQWVFAQHGVALPRETARQFETGYAVEAGDIEAGDLVFFSTVARGASHVGIALDDDRFLHAPSSRGVVRIERRSSAYWQTRYVGARRLRQTDDAVTTR